MLVDFEKEGVVQGERLECLTCKMKSMVPIQAFFEDGTALLKWVRYRCECGAEFKVSGVGDGHT